MKSAFFEPFFKGIQIQINFRIQEQKKKKADLEFFFEYEYSNIGEIFNEITQNICEKLNDAKIKNRVKTGNN